MTSSTHQITQEQWDPENPTEWESHCAPIARRNLIWATITTHIAFSIWTLWSVMIISMPKDQFGLDKSDKFLIGVVAILVGGAGRVPYTVATAKFGGRNWAIFSTLILLIPTFWTLMLVSHPDPHRGLGVYLLCAALTGLGGSNYAAGLANVDAFYPQHLKGIALGICGGIGNLGASAVQLVGLLVAAAFSDTKPYVVCGIYLVALAIAGIGAATQMDNLEQHVEMRHMGSIMKYSDTWALSILYCIAFGSFIGFTFSFGQVIKPVLKNSGHAGSTALYVMFIGPLLAAGFRVWGGGLSDRFGGGRVTFTTLFCMLPTTILLLFVSSYSNSHGHGGGMPAILGFVIGFYGLFSFAGVANGSVLKMIPTAFKKRSLLLANLTPEQQLDWAKSHSAALIGFSTALGTLGGVVINLILRHSFQAYHSATPALWIFLSFYVCGCLITWSMYLRKGAATAQHH